MEQSIAEKLSGESKIDITQIVRESWEILFLKGLFESTYGKYLIFKGGTALRLVYGSPRFSEDLDFSLTKDVFKNKFEGFIKKLVLPYKEASLTDVAEKYYTYLSEIKITQSYLPMPFRIKIEISRRILKSYEYELRLISSPSSLFQVVGNVAQLEQIYKDKLDCVKGRAKPKDFFDIWFLCQRLKIPYSKPQVALSKKVLRRDLRKYLPSAYWNVIENL
ncbi:MAG: nucleotidyl transferase AbiEii/AbiGii toxin family protein [Nitrospira sp.]|nr:nucleotidyl transferase AbiEii/AbiGii toxin family protein [Nitrospira sp.]